MLKNLVTNLFERINKITTTPEAHKPQTLNNYINENHKRAMKAKVNGKEK